MASSSKYSYSFDRSSNFKANKSSPHSALYTVPKAPDPIFWIAMYFDRKTLFNIGSWEELF